MVSLLFSTLLCGTLLLKPQEMHNLEWCNGGSGTAAVWEKDDGDRVALLECYDTSPKYFVTNEHRKYKSFELEEEWQDYVETHACWTSSDLWEQTNDWVTEAENKKATEEMESEASTNEDNSTL